MGLCHPFCFFFPFRFPTWRGLDWFAKVTGNMVWYVLADCPLRRNMIMCHRHSAGIVTVICIGSGYERNKQDLLGQVGLGFILRPSIIDLL